MALVPAICTQCGAQIEADDTQEAGICKRCGTAFITEKAVNKYSAYITNNNDFDGANFIFIRNNVDEELKNIENLINIGKLHDAEEILRQISVRFSANKQIWITYARFSYKKYIEGDNYDEDRKRCIYIESLGNLPLDFIARCQKCLDELKQYKIYCGEETSTEIDNLIEKVIGIKEKSNKEILDYLYCTPKCFCFDSTLGNGSFPIFTWTDSKGNQFSIEQNSTGVIQKFIEACKKNMEMYNYAIRTNSELNDYKMISYLCGEYIAKSLFESKVWKVVGFNGRTLIIKYFARDVYDNKQEVFATNILIKNNVNEIINEACKMQPYKAEPQRGCYIATCVYGSYDCPQVWTLRRYRDYILDKTWYGRVFIKCYYAISPTLVKWFGNQMWFRAFWKKYLDSIVSKLNQKGIDNAQYSDKLGEITK